MDLPQQLCVDETIFRVAETLDTQSPNTNASMDLFSASDFESQLRRPSKRNWKTKIIYKRTRRDGTSMSIQGSLGMPFGNIAHIDDVEVQAEDLSQIQLLDNDTTSFIKNGIGHFCRFGNLNQTPWQYTTAISHKITDDPDLEIQIARVDELFVMRRKYLDLDTRDLVNKYSNTRRYRTLVEEANGILRAQCPGLALVQQVMACLLDKCWNGQFPGDKKHRFKNGARLAHGELYRRRGDAGFAQHFEHLNAFPDTMSVRRREMLDLVKENYKVDIKNMHHQMLLDEVIAEHCVEQIPANIFMVLNVDKNNRLIAEVSPSIENELLPSDTTKRCDKAMDAFHWLYPLARPDHRHQTHYDDHLVRNPELDIDRSSDPHNAVGGVDHCGVGHETGHRGKDDLRIRYFSQKTHRIKDIEDSHAFQQFTSRILPGPYRIRNEINSMLLKALDPELFDEYVEVQAAVASIGKAWQIRPDDPFGYWADIDGTHTEEHTDTSDWIGGLAHFNASGDFTGGDILLKELGFRCQFPAGSHAQVRGSELKHQMTKHLGRRKSQVFTNHESTRQAAYEILGRKSKREAKGTKTSEREVEK